MMGTVTADDVAAAADRIAGGVVRTPCLHSVILSEVTGAEVWVKFENLQFTGSFKDRGALHRVLQLEDAQRAAGVVAASAGNHAQGVAYHCGRLGIPATIVVPTDTPMVKVRRTRALGAELVLEGDTLTESFVAARALEAEGRTFVHPFDDPWVIAGQGTVAKEMMEQAPDIEAVVVPVGGGGLLGGMATAYAGSGTEVWGVQTEAYPGMVAALAGREAPAGASTIAEGIAVKQPSELTTALARERAAGVLVATEASIESAIGMYLEIEKTVAEGAGAASLAALLDHPDQFAGRRVGVVLSGANIDLRVLASVTLRHLVRQCRLARLRVQVEDTPGSLARITHLVAAERANVVEIEHGRLSGVLARRTDIELLLETYDDQHVGRVVAALEGAGFEVRRLEP